MGFGDRSVKGVTKPLLGQFKKNNLVAEKDGRQTVKRFVKEFRVSSEDLDERNIGDDVKAADLIR